MPEFIDGIVTPIKKLVFDQNLSYLNVKKYTIISWLNTLVIWKFFYIFSYLEIQQILQQILVEIVQYFFYKK